MKSLRIEYFYSQGRISKEEYEKWILSECWNFEPTILSEEEAKENFKRKWGEERAKGNNVQWISSPDNETDKLLKELIQITKENHYNICEFLKRRL